jgi:ADP-heptose:LPS heptosyltransferase
MEASVYREKWLSLREKRLKQDELAHLARQIAFSFVDRYYQNGQYMGEYIDLLCEMATFSDVGLANKASTALFEIIVEKLCDDFEDMPVEIYCRVMSQVISYCRNIHLVKALDKTLRDFGILSFDDLYKRAMHIHNHQYSYNRIEPLRKIIFLSRVTIGADVAILSVMIQRLTKLFPQAEIVVIGSSKLEGILGGNEHIRLCPLNYARSGGLLERFSSWHGTLEILAKEMPPEQEERTILIDPDSRISQLGILPLTHSDNYLFFNSRQYTASMIGASMAELTNYWIDCVFGEHEFCFPKVWTAPSINFKAQKLVATLRQTGCRRIIAVNFGVGANQRKKLGIEFEKKLLHEILKEPHTITLLDKGFGAEELSQSTELQRSISNQGFNTISMRFGDSQNQSFSHGLVTIECTVGEVTALINQCDEFIGYDSACQHIAAAVQTPAVTIFAGSNDMNFVRRWSAYGNVPHKIVHVDTLTSPQNIDTNEVISRIMAERQKTEARRQRPALSEVEGTKIRILETDSSFSKPVPDFKKQML